MSNGETGGKNIYEKLWKQQATVNKLILDGKRDPHQFSKLLDEIIKNNEDTFLIPTSKLAQIQKWCVSISDTEAEIILASKSLGDASVIANIRNFAKKVFDWKENIFYKVGIGFDFQGYAPEIGPCYNNWSEQRRWSLKNKKSTRTSLVFWIPRLLPESCSKNVDNQLKLMAAHRKEYNLPENCLKDFGGASLNTLLILERFHRTQERTPLNNYWIRTDTLRLGGDRLDLGYFDDGGLDCSDWLWDGSGGAYLGCFPSGVWNL